MGKNRKIGGVLMVIGLLVIAATLAAGPVYAEATPPVARAPFDFTEVALSIITLATTVITAVVVPWMRAKLGNEKFKAAQILTKATVKAAEQVIGPGKGAQKLAYVKEELEKRGITFNNALIEAAVYDLAGSFLADDSFAFEDEDDDIEDAEDKPIDPVNPA